MRYSPCTGTKLRGQRDREQGCQLALAGVTTLVHVGDAGVYDLRAPARQSVHHLRDGPLVAGDRVRAEDHHVALLDVQPPALARCHLRKCRHGLALGTSRDDADLARVVVADRLDVGEAAVRDRQHSEVAGDADVLHHGPAQESHLAAACDRGVGELLDAVHVAREAGHHDPATPLSEEDPAKRLADRALTAGVAGQLRVRRVGEQEADTFGGGHLTDPREVGPPPVDRCQVKLEVAAVENDALSGVEGEGEPARHRVRHRDELDLERADLAPLAVPHLHEACLLAEPASSRRLRAKPRVSPEP